jgi:hypothetical protein
MLYIIAYTILTYQTPKENLGKFGYKLVMEVNTYIIFWILTNHNLTSSKLINSENGKTKVTYISSEFFLKCKFYKCTWSSEQITNNLFIDHFGHM